MLMTAISSGHTACFGSSCSGGRCVLTRPACCPATDGGMCRRQQPPPPLPLVGLVLALVWTSQSLEPAPWSWHCALRDSSAADRCVECDILQLDVLWPIS